ncbi:hypothetical protein VPG91_03500 [Nitrospirillum amazonense]|uniref:hypothetical protein n=1 Tax=Nitrospirillum amazonense TaxID=28077 RepID=UPI002DD45263|nr:hypothetical protein [Nitrospirillum amazonense]MEC4590038.1 hypothetical protein [Nitrospirillum amazonense]
MNDGRRPILVEASGAVGVKAPLPMVGGLRHGEVCSDRVVALPGAYRDQMRTLASLLDVALRAVVRRYFLDARIRAIYSLPPDLENILRLAAPTPYRVGWYRPDFILDRDGTARICEIGARYPLNGWMVSRAWSRGQADFWDDLCAPYEPGNTVALVHAQEPSGEIDCLSDHLGQAGVGFVAVRPADVSVHAGALHAQGRRLDHLILQLDRNELPMLAPDVLAHLVARGPYFNDVRTVILVHDKRVLTVLSDAEIMRDAMPADLYGRLRPHLIASVCARSPAEAERLLREDGDWIAKPSSGGRGIGALVRSACGEADWADRVRRDWPHLMFQPYLEQLDFNDPDFAGPIHMVGMLLCRDAVCYGNGMFRGSNDAVINLHQQRGKLYRCEAVP